MVETVSAAKGLERLCAAKWSAKPTFAITYLVLLLLLCCADPAIGHTNLLLADQLTQAPDPAAAAPAIPTPPATSVAPPSQPPSLQSTAAPGPAVDTTQLPRVEERSFLHDNQTLIVGAFTFLIGMMTVINAFINTIIARRTRNREEKLKRHAFLAIMEKDISHISEQLQTAKEIINTIDPGEHKNEIQSVTSWVASVRIASRISPLRSFDQEWEKLYMVGEENISGLRDFDIALRDLGSTFDDLLSQPEMLRTQVNPLLPGILGDDDQEQLMATLTSLEDQIDSAIELSEKLLQGIKREFGERSGGNGGVDIPKKCQGRLRGLAEVEKLSAQGPPGSLAKH